MKPVVLSAAIVSLLLVGSNAFSQGTCSGAGGPFDAPLATEPSHRSDDNSNGVTSSSAYASALEAAKSISEVARLQSGTADSQSVPRARLRVVSPPSAGQVVSTPSVPSARLTVVADAPRVAPKADTAVARVTPEEVPATSSSTAEESVANEEDAQLAEALRGLVGTWSAVARHDDGELSTVELQLDDRGWAKLTLPGPDGKPSTIERRVEFKDDELKLTGPDSETSLGKLIEFNSRQMVLARADGQVTFVRP